MIRLFALMLAVVTASGATYYVSPSGSTQNAGTQASPWPLDYASQQVQPGDTVIMRGGSYGATAIYPRRSGTPGNYITYQNFTGETPTFTDPRSGQIIQGILLWPSTSYIRVHGIRLTNTPRWVTISAFGGGTGAGGHNEIAYCYFENVPAGANWTPISVADSSQYNWFHHNTMQKQGGVGSDGQDYGTNAQIGSDVQTNDDTSFNLIENNTIAYGGHDVFSIGRGRNNVFRNNICYNPAWINNTFDGFPAVLGNRCLSLVGARNLIEGNWFAHSRIPEDDNGANGIELSASFQIIRRNRFVDCGQAAIMPYTKWHYAANSNYISHNSIIWSGFDPNMVASNPVQGTANAGGIVVQFNSNNQRIINNVIYKTLQDKSIIFKTSMGSTGHDVRGNFIHSNGNPLFNSTNVLADKTLTSAPDLRLQNNSPCIDNGVWLTTVTSASGSGTTFVVADAGYFCDGFGIIPGDVIQLQGQTATARITSVNYNTRTIAVDTSLSWTTGQGVAYTYSGNGPDQGYWESGQTAEPPVEDPPTITSHPTSRTVTVGENTTFMVTATGTAPLSYQWRKGGGNIGGATSANYTISNVQLTDAGNFDVVVSNSAGSATSSTATLTVNAVSPSGFVNGSFESDLTGWSTSGNVAGATTGATYTASDGSKLVRLNHANSTPNGVLSQTFTNVANQQFTVSFDVGALSFVNTDPMTIRVELIGNSTLFSSTETVNAPGNGTAYSSKSYSFATDSTSTTIRFTDLSASTINVDLVLDNVAIASYLGPVIQVHPVSQMVNQGQSVGFTVTSVGAGLTYQWRKDNVNIGGATSASYNIASVLPADAGSYDVVVSNGSGTATSNPATLDVTAAPVGPGALAVDLNVIP